MPKSTYLALKDIDRNLGNISYSAPATVYVALFTTDPTVAGSGTEVSGGSYARVAVTNNTTNFPSANPKLNGTVVTFPTPSAGWGAVTHAAIYDASTAGNLLFFGALTVPKTINSGDPVTFAAGAMSFTES